jgi:hypothetical protein
MNQPNTDEGKMLIAIIVIMVMGTLLLNGIVELLT